MVREQEGQRSLSNGTASQWSRAAVRNSGHRHDHGCRHCHFRDITAGRSPWLEDRDWALSVAAATLAALQTFFNYGGEAQRHFEASVGFARLWRHMDQFKLRHGRDDAVLEECLVDFAVLVKELDDLEQQAPRISNKVWQQVKNEP